MDKCTILTRKLSDGSEVYDVRVPARTTEGFPFYINCDSLNGAPLFFSKFAATKSDVTGADWVETVRGNSAFYWVEYEDRVNVGRWGSRSVSRKWCVAYYVSRPGRMIDRREVGRYSSPANAKAGARKHSRAV